MEHYQITSIIGPEAEDLLSHQCAKVPKETIFEPSSTILEKVFAQSDRSPEVVGNLHRLYHAGRLAGTGYLSVFPVDQAMEHTAAYSFYKNPAYFDPETIVKVAYEGGCSGVASTLGVLGLMSKKYADKIPFVLKLNHNELLTYPTTYDQIPFASVEQAKNLGAAGVGATIYFGSDESDKQIVQVSRLFAQAHAQGLFTILWCYPRNNQFSKDGTSYESAVDISAQANHIGVTIEADIIKQKIPTAQRGFKDISFAKWEDGMYDALMTDHPIDLVRYQVLHGYAGKIPLINSGGESEGDADNDFRSALRTAIINKRGGGSGLVMGRKVFKHDIAHGIELLHAVQDVYLDPEITVA
ncbi:class I fructose-bisphosphate aldolase [Candidatus Woesebacteria bacterium]|nr:class I fructose-bisphosphate aldolase [Candidatus Woesebacteria bacterium]